MIQGKTPTNPYKAPYPIEIPQEFWILWWPQKSISPTLTVYPYVEGRWYVVGDAQQAVLEHRKQGHTAVLLCRTSYGSVTTI